MKFYIIDHGDNSVGIDSYIEEVIIAIPKKRMEKEFYNIEFVKAMKITLKELYTESTIVEVLTENEYKKQYLTWNEFDSTDDVPF